MKDGHFGRPAKTSPKGFLMFTAIRSVLSMISGSLAGRPAQRTGRRNRALILEQFEDRRLLAVAVDDYYTAPAGGELVVDQITSSYGLWDNDDMDHYWTWEDDSPGEASGGFAPFAHQTEHGHAYPISACAMNNGNDCAGSRYFRYVPDAGFTGVDTFTYWVHDENGEDTGTVYITVGHPPAAFDYEYWMHPDSYLNGSLVNSDSDPDGRTITVSLDSGPEHGFLTLNADGTFTYSPYGGFTGDDTFRYVDDDGLLTSTGTVTIHVGNRAPVARDDFYAAQVDTPLSIDAPGLLSNDTDADSDNLTTTLVSGPSRGSLSLDIDGSFVYTPNTGEHGLDHFIYSTSDGIDESTATVTINLGDHAPVATDTTLPNNVNRETDPLGIWVDTPTSVDVVASGAATDPDGDPITQVRIVTQGSFGTASVSGTLITYMPYATNFLGDSFTYQVFDGYAWSNIATVGSGSILPHPYDDEFDANEDYIYTVQKNHTLDTSAAGLPTIIANDVGFSTGASYLGNGYTPHGGRITLNGGGTFVYIPPQDFIGDDTFVYYVGIPYDGATVTIHVTN